tara:strand:+ start:769 stop:1002 length:234 start_codon:yes stop_codon:yes gene_type:complete
MKKTIYNLVDNSIKGDYSKEFVNQLIRKSTNEEIVELARKEIKTIQYFIKIELLEWNYWKNKEQSLFELILKLSKQK